MPDLGDLSPVLVVRHRRWFEPLVVVEGLDPFPIGDLDAMAVGEPGTWRSRFLIGRGPAHIPLPDTMQLYFEHGELTYPVFNAPSTGPSNAGLFGRARSRSIDVDGDRALFLIELTAVVAFPDHLELPPPAADAILPKDPEDPRASFALAQLNHLARTTALFAGVYSLYQYPLVWKEKDADGFMALIRSIDVDNAQGTSHIKGQSPQQPDNWIPFVLDPSSAVEECELVDGVASNWSELVAENRLEMAFLELDEALHQNEIGSRFRHLGSILEMLSSESGAQDPEYLRSVAELEEILLSNHKEYAATWKIMKGRSLGTTLAERVAAYSNSVGEPLAEVDLRMIKEVRNDLSHGRRPDSNKLAQAEHTLRVFIWKALQIELETAGIRMELPTEDQ